MARWPLGRGEVVLLALPETIENGALGQADHLRLLEALAGRPAGLLRRARARARGRRGRRSTCWPAWGLGPLLVLLGRSPALALLWRDAGAPGRRRTTTIASGAPTRWTCSTRWRSLYDRALRRQALRLYHDGLRAPWHAQTAWSGDALARRADDLTERQRRCTLNEAFRRMQHGTR